MLRDFLSPIICPSKENLRHLRNLRVFFQNQTDPESVQICEICLDKTKSYGFNHFQYNLKRKILPLKLLGSFTGIIFLYG